MNCKKIYLGHPPADYCSSVAQEYKWIQGDLKRKASKIIKNPKMAEFAQEARLKPVEHSVHDSDEGNSNVKKVTLNINVNTAE